LLIAAGQTVYAESQSAVLIGLLAVARLVPTVFIGPAVAPYIQRANRWALMGCLDLISALCMFAVSLRPNAAILFVAAVFLSGVSAIYNVAYRSAIPTLVESDRLIEVNVLRTALGHSLTALGPFVAAMTLRTIGVQSSMLVNGLTFLVSAGTMVYIAVFGRAVEYGVTTAGSSPKRISLRESIAVTLRQPQLRRYFTTALLSGLGYGVLHHLVVYANDVLLGGEAAYGALLSALGTGGLMSLPLLLLPVSRIKPFLGYGLALMLDAVAFLFLGTFVISTSVASAVLFLSGGNDALASMASETIIQQHADPGSSAQAFALDAALSRLATPLSILAVGVITVPLGIRVAFLASAGLLAAAAVSALLVREVTR